MGPSFLETSRIGTPRAHGAELVFPAVLGLFLVGSVQSSHRFLISRPLVVLGLGYLAFQFFPDAFEGLLRVPQSRRAVVHFAVEGLQFGIVFLI